MKVIIRAKRGEPVQVLDENGNAIPGLKRAEVRLEVGRPAEVYLLLQGAVVTVDADAAAEVADGGAFVSPETAEALAQAEQPKSEPAA